MNGNAAWNHMIGDLVRANEPEKWEDDTHQAEFGVAYAELFLFNNARVIRTTRYKAKPQDDGR